MSKLLGLSLGILAAIGGYVDIGDLVFNTAAGASFGYQLMWVIPIGVIGIIVYAEMCGRVAAVSGKAVFDSVRERAGFKAGLSVLVSSEVVNLMTLAAELGGVAIALQLLAGLPYRWLILIGAVVLALIMWVTSFEWIERLFGYGGLCMLVFAVAAVKIGPSWDEVGRGFIPHIAANSPGLYAYFVVGLLGSALTPYEVYFYSSGGVEERWTPKDIGLNRMNAIVGYSLGATLSLALMILGATIFLGHSIAPEHLGTVALATGDPLGKVGLLIGLVGIVFAVGGASIDTVFSGAYNLAQFFGWEWGRYRHPKGAPRFTLTWVVLLILATGILMTGVDPVTLTEYAVIFSVVALPLTYAPILLVANDRTYMGSHTNGRLANIVGSVYLLIILLVALAAIPLMILTNAGQLIRGEFDIGLHLLDRQLIDAKGRRCGKVDDLAIEGGPDESPEVVALLIGPGYWRQRAGWIGTLASVIGGGSKVRIPWSEVDKVDSAIHLKREASVLGLGRGDDRLRPSIEKIPGARR